MSTEIQKQIVLAKLAHGLSVLAASVLAITMLGPSLGCAAEAAQDKDLTLLGATLRVGITPDYPPLVFREVEATNGLEIDLARALGAELNRRIEFVVLRWDQQIPALLENRTDIIMSGMSITKARQLRIAFSEPYLHSQLRAIFRRGDAARFKTAADILQSNCKIGVIPGTTGDAFVAKSCPNARRVPFSFRRDIPGILSKTVQMDVFIDDTFALAPMIAEHESELAYLEEPLSEEDFGWGLRPGDSQSLATINRILAKWKSDGTLDRAVQRWLPYLKNFKPQQPTTTSAGPS